MKDDHRDGPVPPEGRDDVADLIRLAGRRPAAPGDRRARVKAASHEHWLALVRRRRRRNYAWAAASVAAAASLALMLPLLRQRPAPGPSPTAATVESVQGSVWIGPAAAGRGLLGIGNPVPAGSSVGSGADGRLALRLATGGSLRLDRSTRLRVEDADTIALEIGSVYVDSGEGGAAAGSLVIRTPLGVVREIGTRYEVRLRGDGLRVRVREGRVALDDGRQVREVAVADELSLAEDGSAATRRISIHGPDWDWIAQVTAVPDLDGMSSRDFLEWVAKERGWRLRFATEELERAAGDITLDGSLDRLSLDEALDAVLPACGLGYRLEQDMLIVGSSGEGLR